MRIFFRGLFPLAVLCSLVFSIAPLHGQSDATGHKNPLVLSLFNLGTQLPGSGTLGIFTTPIHPGISAGTEFSYNRHPLNHFFQTAKLGLYYHQYVQTGIQLYSEAGYRRFIWRGTAAELRLGAGYLHAIAGTEVFKLKDGAYKKTANLGRPQFMGSGAFGLSYTLQKGERPPRFFLDYQFFLQMPFVKSYVPLEPNVALHLGVAFPCF
ncbi:MAG: hypothetical protein SFV22_04175 [Saprospiraceae bacterium]|nr:hypothetical protein [Saprospiraceae bacterium]